MPIVEIIDGIKIILQSAVNAKVLRSRRKPFFSNLIGFNHRIVHLYMYFL